MSNHFVDTSALVKHYHPEVGTPKVDLLWATQGARLFISRLSVVESVFRLGENGPPGAGGALGDKMGGMKETLVESFY